MGSTCLLRQGMALMPTWSPVEEVVMEGIGNIQVSYISGLFIQLQFESHKFALDFKNSATGAWRTWFKYLEFWTPTFNVKERLARISIRGLPPHDMKKQ
ncbi:hypothetical protein L1887_20040 [Cichorium endivia]|nr:hypothetical protein L1887_20040 [Cichorium endivia]